VIEGGKWIAGRICHLELKLTAVDIDKAHEIIYQFGSNLKFRDQIGGCSLSYWPINQGDPVPVNRLANGRVRGG